MQGNNLEAKQQYLREKIIDAGHDPEQFVEFCSSKHNLDDLENWSMHELIDIVQAFLLHIRPPLPNESSAQHAQTEGVVPNFGNNTSQQAIAGNAVEGKMGLVLTEDDWSMLLSGPSIVASKNEEKPNSSQHNPFPNLDFAFPVLEPPQQKVEPPPKDSPLSPPSTMQKPQLPIDPNSIKTQMDQVSLKDHVRQQKKSDKKSGNESQSVINLSNVVLTTAKQRTLQPLPSIQDVVVSKTEQITRNFLQGDYTLYHITFLPCQLTIQRKFADLIKMRGILSRLYPFLRLPYLEPEGWLSSSQGKDPETLAKYKWMVEQFMRFLIVRSDELRQSEVVRFFCGLTKKEYQKDEFRKKLEAYEAVPRPKFIGEVILTNNILTLPPTSPADKFAIASSTLISELDVQYERLRRQLDYLFANYELLIKSYSDISSTFATMQMLLNRNSNDKEGKQFGAFAGLQEMVARLSSKIERDGEMFRSRIRSLFRYERENMTTLKHVIDSSSAIHYEFARQGCPPLSGNKVKGGNMEIQSPVPLEDPIKNNKPMLAVQEIFWSFTVRKEVGRYWQHLRRRISEGLTLIAYDQLDSQNENLNFWNTMIKRCVL